MFWLYLYKVAAPPDSWQLGKPLPSFFFYWYTTPAVYHDSLYLTSRLYKQRAEVAAEVVTGSTKKTVFLSQVRVP